MRRGRAGGRGAGRGRGWGRAAAGARIGGTPGRRWGASGLRAARAPAPGSTRVVAAGNPDGSPGSRWGGGRRGPASIFRAGPVRPGFQPLGACSRRGTGWFRSCSAKWADRPQIARGGVVPPQPESAPLPTRGAASPERTPRGFSGKSRLALVAAISKLRFPESSPGDSETKPNNKQKSPTNFRTPVPEIRLLGATASAFFP